MIRPTKEKLLEQAARKPVRRLLQLDGFNRCLRLTDRPPEPTEVFPEGCDCFASETYELRGSGPQLAVRVHIAEGAARSQVLALMDICREVLEEKYDGTIGSVMWPDMDWKAEVAELLEESVLTDEEASQVLKDAIIPQEGQCGGDPSRFAEVRLEGAPDVVPARIDYHLLYCGIRDLVSNQDDVDNIPF